MDTDDEVSQHVWYVLDVRAESSAREPIEYALMEARALGTETNDDRAEILVRGYFAQRPEIEAVRLQVLDSLRIYNVAPESLIDFMISEIPNRDWLAEWKKNWQPIQVGRFLVAPPWSEPPAVAGGPNDRIIIRINPGMAFGTGTHETTRLCLQAIEEYFSGGSFLDVGTGTGILAIAAAKMFPVARVDACDTDAQAIAIAKENAALNDVAGQIVFRIGTVDAQTPSADFVCANLTAPVIVELLPALLGATCGRLVLSGILDSQLGMIRSRLMELGIHNFEVAHDGEWIAIVI